MDGYLYTYNREMKGCVPTQIYKFIFLFVLIMIFFKFINIKNVRIRNNAIVLDGTPLSITIHFDF